MKLQLIAVFAACTWFANFAQAQNPKPCTNVLNTAAAGQVLSANSAGNTPPCKWINNGGGGSPAFSAITTGINTTALMTVGSGANLTFTGTGIINASKILGTTLTGLTGPIKFTSGIPSVAHASDIVGLFSTCSGTQYLGADGACHNSGGGAAPAGPTGAVQYKVDGTTFGGSNSVIFDAVNGVFNIFDSTGNKEILTIQTDSSATDPDCTAFFVINCDFDRPPATSTLLGSNGGDVDIFGKPGGNTTIVTDGHGGSAGGILLQGNSGGEAPAAATSSSGASGGTIDVVSGNGGNANNGANLGVNLGGRGGIVDLKGGNGGNAANGSSNTGGSGGNALIIPGDGGTGNTANGIDGTIINRGGSNANNDITQWQLSNGTVTSKIDLAGRLNNLSTAFAALGTPVDGAQQYCSDCTVTSGSDNTCAASGTGAQAFRVNGVWRCSGTGGGGGSANPAELHTVTFSTTPAFACTSGSAGTVETFELSTTLSANITPTISGCTSGQTVNIRLKQDGTGGRTVTWPAAWNTLAQPSPLANIETTYVAVWDGTSGKGSASSDGQGTCPEQAAPGVSPPAGSEFPWCDSTGLFPRWKNSSGTIFQAAKELTAGNLRKAGGANAVDSAAAAADVVGLFSTCSGTQYLGADGACHDAVTAASAATAAKQTCVSSGASKTCTYISFPDVKTIPAANCNNTTGGNGWSIGSGGTVTCRAGTNNLGGFISITDTSSTFAQFMMTIPEDWDSATLPYIRFQIASTDSTNGHTIIPQIKVSCAKGDGTTTDDVTFNAAHSLSTTTLNTTANQFWSGSNVQLNSTDMTGCVAGALMIVQVGRATDTATNAEFYSATITMPRLLTVQAN